MASAYLGAFFLIMSFVIANNEIASTSLTHLQILAILYLGVVPTGIGFYLWNKGSKYVKSSTLAIMNNLRIPFGVLFSILIFHEKIDVLNFILGSSVIILAILILHLCLKQDA